MYLQLLQQQQINHIVINIDKVQQEILEVEEAFPNLYFEYPHFVKGEINICAVYDGKNLIHNPDQQDKEKYKNTFVKDVYEIKIDLSNYKIYEMGNRINRTSDNHINSDGSCCLGLFDKQFKSLIGFIKFRVLPFFVWHGYKSKYNKTPPWGEWSHGEQGLKEFKQAKKDLGRNDPCLCGSGIKYKKCCLTQQSN